MNLLPAKLRSLEPLHVPRGGRRGESGAGQKSRASFRGGRANAKRASAVGQRAEADFIAPPADPVSASADSVSAGGELISEGADFCTGLLEIVQPQVTQFAQGITAYVRLILEGPASTVLVPVPVFNIASAGTPVLPGALKRIFAFIANMKKRAFCTEAVQQDLQIIGAAVPAPDPATAQPALKVRLATGGLPEVLWTYRAIYLLNDADFGQWSDAVSISVAG